MLKYRKTGDHIIADLYNCDFNQIATYTPNQIRDVISDIILRNSLTELGNYYHFFDDNISFTAVISLAESHISVHTWPEDQYISLDIFVCNYTMDKSSSADQVYQDLINLFNPQHQKKRVIRRFREVLTKTKPIVDISK